MNKVKFNQFQNKSLLLQLENKGQVLKNYEDILEDVTKIFDKVPTTEYLEWGETAIVDQGKQLIAGYCNKEVSILKKPKIVFGDHTKNIKYIDFPFIIGADGTKVLDVIDSEVSEKYIYYFLKNLEIPSLGYARHFKYIKEVVFPIPSPKIQQKITENLTKLDTLIYRKKEQLAYFDNLVKSRFNEMFGDPVLNEMGWERCNLKDISVGKLSYGSGASAVDFSGIRYIRITDIDDSGNLKPDIKSPSVHDRKYLLNDGDILFARSGATVGKTFLYSSQKYGEAIYAGYLIKLTPNLELVNPEFVYHFTNTNYYNDFISKTQRAVAQPNINAQQYGELNFILPPLSLQNEFAAFVEEVDKSKLAIQKSLNELETLKKSLMQEYFG